MGPRAASAASMAKSVSRSALPCSPGHKPLQLHCPNQDAFSATSAVVNNAQRHTISEAGLHMLARHGAPKTLNLTAQNTALGKPRLQRHISWCRTGAQPKP